MAHARRRVIALQAGQLMGRGILQAKQQQSQAQLTGCETQRVKWQVLQTEHAKLQEGQHYHRTPKARGRGQQKVHASRVSQRMGRVNA